MTELLSMSPSRVVQEADAFKWDGNALESGIALALSGGGFRAMLFHAGALMRLNELGATARFGTYWGIDIDPTKISPTGALPCAEVTVNKLAHLGTRLSDLGETESKQLINWGYAICDRCVRVHYNVPELQQKPAPQWPYPQASLA